jgi:prevent-host-death family protein
VNLSDQPEEWVVPKAKTAKDQGPKRESTSKAHWQFRAKARFSELFRRARSQGPQRITRQGEEGVVMISDEQYERLIGNLINRKASCSSSVNRRW